MKSVKTYVRDGKIWYKWTGGDCPIPFGTLCHVQHRDGEVVVNCRAGVGCAEDWSIDRCNHQDGDIMSYSLGEPAQC